METVCGFKFNSSRHLFKMLLSRFIQRKELLCTGTSFTILCFNIEEEKESWSEILTFSAKLKINIGFAKQSPSSGFTNSIAIGNTICYIQFIDFPFVFLRYFHIPSYNTRTEPFWALCGDNPGLADTTKRL